MPQSTFADRVKAARLVKGLTQKDVAEAVGVTLQSVRDWERRGAIPNSKRLIPLAGVLAVPVSWLVTGKAA